METVLCRTAFTTLAFLSVYGSAWILLDTSNDPQPETSLGPHDADRFRVSVWGGGACGWEVCVWGEVVCVWGEVVCVCVGGRRCACGEEVCMWGGGVRVGRRWVCGGGGRVGGGVHV